jgi:hypothetical protein
MRDMRQTDRQTETRQERDRETERDTSINQSMELAHPYLSFSGQGISSDIKAITGDDPIRFAQFVKTNIKPLLK